MSAAQQRSPRHPSITLPTSYDTLPFTQIQTKHHPSEPSIIILTLHRPNAHNAFTDTMRAELESGYAMFNVDARVKCIVLTGSGRIFCAGADLEIGFGKGADGEGEDEAGESVREHRDGGGRVALTIHNSTKPTIAALNGSAVGVGITMTLPCAIRVAPSAAKIGFVFARRGIVMEACSSFFLPRLIGHSRAMQAVTTGSTYRADDRVWDGLFAETLEKPADVLPRALEIAGEVVRNTSGVSTYLMKQMMWRDAGSPEGQHLLDSRVLFELYGSLDNNEGVQSFMEKRQAKFNGTLENTKLSQYPWWMPLDMLGKAKAVPMSKAKI